MEITRVLKMFRSANTYSCCLFERLCPVSFVFSKAGAHYATFTVVTDVEKRLCVYLRLSRLRFCVCQRFSGPDSGSMCTSGSPGPVLALCQRFSGPTFGCVCVSGVLQVQFWLYVYVRFSRLWFCVCQRFSRPSFGSVCT